MPAPALAEPRTLPFASTAKQNVDVTQDTPLRELTTFAVSTSESVHVADAP